MNIIEITAAILTVIWMAWMLIYAQQLQQLISYANEHDSALFGRRYRSTLTLLRDRRCAISFFNDVFSGREISTHSDAQLVTQLQKVRTSLRATTFLIIACLVLVWINVAVK